jgi:cytochrome c
MDDLGFNKIAGAVLATGLGFMLLMKLPGLVMADSGEAIAYKVGAIETTAGEEEPIDLPFPQADWVAAMDASKGAKVFKKCKSCHNVDAGGPNGTGPALYGVVDNAKASHAGYNYSAALMNLDSNWTYEALDAYLEKPSKYAPGTKMNFVGLKKPADRAAVIEYLRVADSAPSDRPEAMPAEPIEAPE